MNRGGLCETCMRPGSCCKDLYLSGGGLHNPQSLESVERRTLELGLFMFRPLHQDEYGRWRFWCTNLQPDGRCGDYEGRPELCRTYNEGYDGLCVHHWTDPAKGDVEAI